MAKITRYTGDLQAFASDSLGTERTVFGDVTQADDLDSNINTDFLRGWGTVGVNENPTKQDFNALGYTATQLLAYLHQMGMAEWDGAQEYQIGSFVNRSGAIYRCLTADHVSATAPEADATNWTRLSTGEQKITVVSVSGSFVPDENAKSLKFTAIGAGGGAGGVDGQGAGTGASSGAGAAGGCAIKTTNSVEASYSITIGAAGTGGAAGANNGGTGGTTSVASTSVNLTANGGNGGPGRTATASVSVGSGVAGGTASGGDLNIDGQGTSTCGTNNGDPLSASSGASSFLGGGARGVNSTDGVNASTFGSGGGATSTTNVTTDYAGGDGAQGVVIVEEQL